MTRIVLAEMTVSVGVSMEYQSTAAGTGRRTAATTITTVPAPLFTVASLHRAGPLTGMINIATRYTVVKYIGV